MLGLPIARGGGPAVGAILGAVEHRPRYDVVHGEPWRRRRRDGPEALARTEARHVADELGDVPEIPDMPVRLPGRIAELHFHDIEHRTFPGLPLQVFVPLYARRPRSPRPLQASAHGGNLLSWQRISQQ